MDIMDKVNDLVEVITKNDDLMAQFKKDPVKAVKGLVEDLDLDDDLQRDHASVDLAAVDCPAEFL